MKKLATLAAAAAILTAAVPAAVVAQGTPQTIAAVDVQALSTGLRSSKIVGSEVVNENKETIGKIDDLVISRDDNKVYAIISVGGFLGIGSKLVAVDYDSLRPTSNDNGFVLAGATKDGLKSLPEYKYSE
jgi:sporulation protein YlmC with PRC-barrel domain